MKEKDLGELKILSEEYKVRQFLYFYKLTLNFNNKAAKHTQTNVTKKCGLECPLQMPRVNECKPAVSNSC